MDDASAGGMALCPPALSEIIEEFVQSTAREKLDILLEFSASLPALPERLHGARDSMEQVHECQSPVFLHTELEGAGETGRVHFYIDVPPEAPTVRGYASALVSGLNGCTAAEVLAVPEDLYMLMGLPEAITPQRLRGLHALMVYMKRQVRRLSQ